MVLTLVGALLVAAPSCPAGQEQNAETAGNCCWPRQVWSNTQNRCVGVPQCPVGTLPSGETCIAAACPAGKQVGPDTGGECCWPAQVWSNAQHRCVGIPQCPAGLLAQGEECATASNSAPPAPPQDAPVQAPPSLTDTRGVRLIDGIEVPPGHHLERHPRKGLWITGTILFGAGWLLALLADVGAGIYAGAVTNGNNCLSYVSQTVWIPLVGPAIAVGGQDRLVRDARNPVPCTTEVAYAVGVPIAIFDTVLQVAGVTMFVLGLTLKQTVVVPDDPNASADTAPAELYVSLGAPGTSTGLTVGLRW
jgi:hypothetical protein